MNDRFRFRVWSVREKEMIYNAEIAYDGTNYPTEWQLGENNNDGWICCFGEYIDRKEDYKVMQCTGLKDKNGRLIYEGDIVWTDEDGYGHIRWDNELAQFFVATEEYYTFDNIFPSEMEVVGNIHQDSHLLEN